MSRARYFPDPAPGPRAQLDRYLDRLRTSAEGSANLRLLLLGGGYGRGEGGLWKPADGDEPELYNDLEFYLFVTRPSPEHAEWVKREIEAGHRETGIEIEIKTLRDTAMERARPSMFYYDLVAGHLPIAGDQAWFDRLPANLGDPTAIPADEAPRLLVNRAGSLLLCTRAAREGRSLETGFTARIIAKLQLALGDAILCATGHYHWSCLERGRGLADLAEDFPHATQLREWHRLGEDFKLHPRPSTLTGSDWLAPLDQMRAVWCDVFLWIESRRLRQTFASPADYADFPGALLPHESAVANAARRLRLVRSRRRLLPGPWTRHPRETVLRALPLLIDPARDADQIQRAARLLGCPPDAAASTVEDACRALWQHCP